LLKDKKEKIKKKFEEQMRNKTSSLTIVLQDFLENVKNNYLKLRRNPLKEINAIKI
jgi:hypothetical protein